MKKILVFLGNGNKDSYSGNLADAYVDGATLSGFEVQRINIGDLQFDPILHNGYRDIQQLEPDLLMVQEKINWADHIVFIYPNWWCSMPAIMKGMFDRMWLPGFAFNFDKVAKKLVQRLTGKTARVIIVAGSHTPFMTWWKFGDYTNEISHGILGFAGIKTSVTALGPCERVEQPVRNAWIEKIKGLGAQGK
ncbi:MAG: NAD(P)H-dependent oxidoreductase [Candidatus Pacebacteria bacterium]|nr:NAD(P)H-dependent oxidoreductase [Candidatus Paceibacterota bacterium]MCF7857040.1 NAD(P)H-dependent oxidoreductase [Candidatus Paceibacterota bacterium]